MLFRLVIAWIAMTFVLIAGSSLIPDVRFRSRRSALGTAAVFGVANLLLGWILTLVFKAILFIPALLTLMLAWLLVPFIVNTILLWVAEQVMEREFEVKTARGLVLLSIWVTVATSVLRRLLVGPD